MERTAGLPGGTVTFLFSDIEGSTRLLQRVGDRYADALGRYREILRAAARSRGHEVNTAGDATFFVFARVTDAVSAAVDAQQQLGATRWPEGAVCS